MKTEIKLHPFNLPAALRGEQVAHRDGTPVLLVVHVPGAKLSATRVVAIYLDEDGDTVIDTHHEGGQWCRDPESKSHLDLFMVEEWETVTKYACIDTVINLLHDTLEKSIEAHPDLGSNEVIATVTWTQKKGAQ